MFSMWVNLLKAVGPSYKGLISPIASLIVSYAIFTIVTAIAARIMNMLFTWRPRKENF